jgi:hypothetical protein
MQRSPLDAAPERRPLRIFAFDPMLARAGEHRITVEIPYRAIERDERRFHDDRLEVVDYDAATGRYYRALDLNDKQVAMTQGVEPLEQDPRFHQQMVYAVASKVLEHFDRALGRRLRFKGGDRLRLFPHAFQGRNAYFDEDLNAVLFGYFTADEDDPGANLPGQLIFTCLSHDIVAHEVTHAALGRLHRYYNEPTNPEVPALHEAFADIVAMFQRLTYPEVVAPVLRETRGDLLGSHNRLLDLGAQFGSAMGRGGALRRIAATRDPALYAKTREPHRLGWILVSAVYDGFVRTYERRTRDLIRIATGGSGRLPEGELHPDLVSRLCTEAVRTAQAVLWMCIRATDYLPPVDPTFSDFLRAMVTADFELNRADDSGLRAAMIEAFRQRGIHPKAVGSLAVQSLLLEPEDRSGTPADPELGRIGRDLVFFGAKQLERKVRRSTPDDDRPRRAPRKSAFDQAQEAESFDSEGVKEAKPQELTADEEPEEVLRNTAKDLWRWADRNRQRLSLDPTLPFFLSGFHSVHRTASNGELLIEMVAQFVQTGRPMGGGEDIQDLGGLEYRAGVTVVANTDGHVRYLIEKPFHRAREKDLLNWVQTFDSESGRDWPSDARKRDPKRISDAYSARAMDGRRWR